MTNDRIFNYKFAGIYAMYLAKVSRKNHTEKELRAAICWLTGYDEKSLSKFLAGDETLAGFFADAPKYNPKSAEISGSICGVKVQEIVDPLMKKIRQMDKLVDDLANSRAMKYMEK